MTFHRNRVVTFGKTRVRLSASGAFPFPDSGSGKLRPALFRFRKTASGAFPFPGSGVRRFSVFVECSMNFYDFRSPGGLRISASGAFPIPENIRFQVRISASRGPSVKHLRYNTRPISILLYTIYTMCMDTALPCPHPHIYDTLSCTIRHPLCTHTTFGSRTAHDSDGECGLLREVACSAVHC